MGLTCEQQTSNVQKENVTPRVTYVVQRTAYDEPKRKLFIF